MKGYGIGQRKGVVAGSGVGLFVALGIAMVTVAGGCVKKQDALEPVKSALVDCDYGESCIAALKDLGKLGKDLRDSTAGVEARMLSLRVRLHVEASFPHGMGDFWKKAKIDRGKAFADMRSEIKDVAGFSEWKKDLADATTILEFLSGPTCEGFKALEQVRKTGGYFADTAAMARMSALAQLLAAAEPRKAHVTGRLIRNLMGCLLADRASTDAVMVEARNMMYDLVEECTRNSPGDAAHVQSCDGARTLREERELLLPLPDVGAGDILGALLPKSIRGVGLTDTPPWALVLTAGRLGIWDQPILQPGSRQSGSATVTPLIDLRQPHLKDNVFYEISKALDSRKKFEVGKLPACAVIVDRSTTAVELFEVLEGLLTDSNAIPLIATSVVGSPVPRFIPFNFLLEERMLLTAIGGRVPFGEAASAEAVVTPFAVDIALMGRQESAELGRELSGRTPDLRGLYNAALKLVGQDRSRPLRLKVKPTVTTARLMDVLQVLSLRVPDTSLVSAERYRSARPMRNSRGGYDFLFTVTVVVPMD